MTVPVCLFSQCAPASTTILQLTGDSPAGATALQLPIGGEAKQLEWLRGNAPSSPFAAAASVEACAEVLLELLLIDAALPLPWSKSQRAVPQQEQQEALMPAAASSLQAAAAARAIQRMACCTLWVMVSAATDVPLNDHTKKELPSTYVAAKCLRDAMTWRPAQAATRTAKGTCNPMWSQLLQVCGVLHSRSVRMAQ